MQKSHAGDEIFIYFSGHGTSALDAGLGLPIPDGSGAFAPFDATLSGSDAVKSLLVGRLDLRPLFEELDRGGRKLWIVSDSCYSAALVRSVGNEGLPKRSLPALDRGDVAQYLKMRERAVSHVKSGQPYPYRHAVFLAAAAEGETAKDIPTAYLDKYPTIDGRPHGTLTDALLRVLKGQLPADFDGNGTVSLDELHQAVGQFMAQRGYGHTPQGLPSVMEDTGGLASRSLLQAKGLGGVTVARPSFAQDIPKLQVDISALPAGLQSTLPTLPLVQWSATNADLKLTASAKVIRMFNVSGDMISELKLADHVALVGQLQQLAWTQRMDLLARKNRRAVLRAEIEPAFMGGNFLIGDKLHFTLRSDRAAKILLINADSAGKVSVLYPYAFNELGVVESNKKLSIPGESPDDQILVKEPFGMDVQLVFAFDQPGPDLKPWMGRTDMVGSDPQLAELERLLVQSKDHFTFTRTELRVLQKP
jgi:hypothetical protein